MTQGSPLTCVLRENGAFWGEGKETAQAVIGLVALISCCVFTECQDHGEEQTVVQPLECHLLNSRAAATQKQGHYCDWAGGSSREEAYRQTEDSMVLTHHRTQAKGV